MPRISYNVRVVPVEEAVSDDVDIYYVHIARACCSQFPPISCYLLRISEDDSGMTRGWRVSCAVSCRQSVSGASRKACVSLSTPPYWYIASMAYPSSIHHPTVFYHHISSTIITTDYVGSFRRLSQMPQLDYPCRTFSFKIGCGFGGYLHQPIGRLCPYIDRMGHDKQESDLGPDSDRGFCPIPQRTFL